MAVFYILLICFWLDVLIDFQAGFAKNVICKMNALSVIALFYLSWPKQ